MKATIAVLLFTLLLGHAAHCLAGLFDQEIVFSESEIEAALAKTKPQTKNFGGLMSVGLAEPPRITLGTPEGRVGIAARINLSLLGNPAVPVDVKGTAGIRYDDNAKAFFLENPVADSIESQALPKESEPNTRRTINALMTSYFRTKPVYVLRENGNAKETAARWLLRSVRIEPGRVIATLSPL